MASAHPPSRRRPVRVVALVRSFPIPIFATAALALGAGVAYGRHDPALGNLVWFAALVVGGLPLVVGTARRLWHRQFASDVIATAAILAAIVLAQPLAGVVIVIMQSGGEAIERYAFRRASTSLEQLIDRAPRFAQRREGSTFRRVGVESVRPGDRLLVRTGDLVPVDGVVEDATAVLDESAVTGEPVPRSRERGATILSGTVSVGAPFEMRALRASGESQYMRIVELVRESRAGKPEIERLADRSAAWFTPLALIAALLAAVVDRNPVTGLAVLVVATPCPLILATPIAIIRGVDAAAGRGLIAKSGAAMEALGRAQVVLFDKTGTLTRGHPTLREVVGFRGRSPDEVLRLASGVEPYSSHPLARAVGGRDVPGIASTATDVHEYPGAGIAGTIDGHRVVVGSKELCENLAGRSIDAPGEGVGRPRSEAPQLTAFVLLDGVLVGRLTFGDSVRPEAVAIGGRLRRLGIREVGLLTGDRLENAEPVAREAGIARVEGSLSPEGKVARVHQYGETFGATVMVGDGINDAGALAAASVGVAMGAEGGGISAEAADVVLIADDVGRVADGIAIGQRMLRIARQGIAFGLGASLVLMAIAGAGLVPPAFGAGLQEVIDATVIFNALRAG